MSTTIPHIDQHVFIVPSFTLECGTELKEALVAYKTWGRPATTSWLFATRSPAAPTSRTGGPPHGAQQGLRSLALLEEVLHLLRQHPRLAVRLRLPHHPDPASPLRRPYGPTFPPTSIRDDVRIHLHVLHAHLGVRRVAAVIGGSMGGMTALEWPLCAPPEFMQRIVVLASSARHSAWCIAWGESQRQSIYSDPAYRRGYYYEVEGGEQPRNGLAAARMCALLTYRSRDSCERRFGRKVHAAVGKPATPTPTSKGGEAGLMTPPASPALEAVDLHNDGQRSPSSSSHRRDVDDARLGTYMPASCPVATTGIAATQMSENLLYNI
ncbi:Alpha/Beta hydrolase protein [Mycena albidolilacea]|uniref:Alpha/Beta hydrolase protein n=1 Tax=Mycena albidolilacea TaxID=1033008 RepID=A0AAD7EAS3_9AGAR|nr:Alpha/Beta hydrolase protein [Mycena albidolilacea]